MTALVGNTLHKTKSAKFFHGVVIGSLSKILAVRLTPRRLQFKKRLLTSKNIVNKYVLRFRCLVKIFIMFHLGTGLLQC